MEGALAAVPPVEIDQGVFKYVLIELQEANGAKRTLLRGYTHAEYHDDVYQAVRPGLDALGLKSRVLGGGRIRHVPDQEIFVYGYSMAYGQGDHALAVDMLRKAYPSYPKIHFSNEGY
ncbi:uncharacterized protein MONBRDRAFT_22478 [Monosiga brevicollis MX1]|uniref:Sex-regulated protein janus-B n=1 Tax=Monosiga brevicollis TaxID=81824 RepID=A9UQP9_MONBE|nr:uncharacterized protein MONBRDRAFT_22478 [Monosiga brevicollis MX1]EDQ92636.1 predicted protein [Monosiga brevicollis MX1]|eukprot:XP_001742398.1 hypothetical protein [Monosiga brevicollis MX1]